MKKIEVGQTISILANVGVLIGILLLVYELGQNRRMMMAQTRNAIADTLVELQSMQATNQDLQQISVKVDLGEELSPREQEALRARWTAFFRYWENVHYQYRNGLYDADEYVAQREAWVDVLLRLQPVRDLWCSRQERQSRQFTEELNDLLGEFRCTQ